MAKAKRGRPKKAGDRYPGGQLKSVVDRGSERLVELHAKFAPFQGGKGAQWAGTPIGRAWLVGLLDGYEADPAAIRDAGLGYAERYWGYYGGGPKVGGYEGRQHAGFVAGNGKDSRGERFNAIDRAIRDAGRASADAVHALVIDCHWFPDDNPPWLDRLINLRLLAKGRPVAGQLPVAGDEQKLIDAIHGLLPIVAGKRRAA
jgi:hypothetical protein